MRIALDGACNLPAADRLLEAIDAVWAPACSALDRLVYRDDYISSQEISLHCEPSPGREVHLSLIGYDRGNAPYAFQYFSSSNEFEDVELGGAARARFADTVQSVPGRQLRSRIMVWQFDCWVGRVFALDEPADPRAPDPRPLSVALLEVRPPARH